MQPSKKLERVALMAGMVLLTALVIFAGLPQSTRLMHVVHKLGHPVAFGLIALLALRLLSHVRRNRDALGIWMYFKALAIAVVAGAATEVAQLYTHRGSSVTDVISDTVGAIACLAFHAAFLRYGAAQSRRTKFMLIAVGSAATAFALWPLAECLAAYTKRNLQFPSIMQPQSSLDMYFISTEAKNVTRMELPAKWSNGNVQPALRVAINTGEYPGLQIFEPYPDWRAFKTLSVDMTNPGMASLNLIVRVHDRAHNRTFNDRFNRNIIIAPESRTVFAFPLNEIQSGPKTRKINLQSIADVSIFSDGPVPDGEFFISRIWLE